MITEWKDLEGRTIEKVHDIPCEVYLLEFEDGECACIGASGEEMHGAHWPVLVFDDSDIGTKLRSECRI